jgi:hypothetical protein
MSRRAVMNVDFPQFVHLQDEPPEQICYEVHIEPPYKHASNYIGRIKSGGDLCERLWEHEAGEGSVLLKSAVEAGCTLELVRTWEGDGYKERALKVCSGKQYCPKCTDEPRAGMRVRQGSKHTTRRQREAAALQREHEKKEKAAREKKGPGVEDREFMPLVRPEPHTPTREELAEQEKAMTEMEALWARQAKERDMKQAEIEARLEGGEAGEREVLEGIERGMDPDEAMARHEEIAGVLDHEAETPQDRSFADAYWISGRYAGESAREEIRDPQGYAELEPREEPDRELAGREMGA